MATIAPELKAPPVNQTGVIRARILGLMPAMVILAGALVVGTLASPYFLDLSSMLVNTGRYVEVGLLALALTIVIINGDIDLSVASNLAVCAATLGLLTEAGIPLPLAGLAAVIVGIALGALNGFFVTVLNLPSLVVTLATLALYRGVAQVMLGDRAITSYPSTFLSVDQVRLFSDSAGIPVPLMMLFAFALLFWFLLQKTDFGLECFLTGSNANATRFSGISTGRTRMTAFCLSGMMAGTAAVLITSRLGSTRSNIGLGLELLAITVVVLGGTDIFGGRGSIGGTVLALFAVMAVREAMAIKNVNGQTQDAVVGVILILAILIPSVIRRVQERRRRKRRSAATKNLGSTVGELSTRVR